MNTDFYQRTDNSALDLRHNKFPEEERVKGDPCNLKFC